MAKNIKEVRETIGKDDEPIKVVAYEPRMISIELGAYKLDDKANHNQKDVKSIELSEGMSIKAYDGGKIKEEQR
mgnify:FL=1